MRSFGRIRSRTLKPNQSALFDSLLPDVVLTTERIEQLKGGPGALVAETSELWLEIGFGAGEHLCAQAKRHPEALILGCEPFLNGVGSALRLMDQDRIDNIRLLPSDGRPLIDALPAGSVSNAFILFPDPWPKSRHHKRRLIQPELVTALARILAPQKRVRFATDWADYADWTLGVFEKSGLFDWRATSACDWTIPPEDHVPTRYQEKALGDCPPVWFDFYRKP